MNQQDILAVLSDASNCNCLERMGEIHRHTKYYLLLAEELSTDGTTFLQPLKEHRDAYDHLMRIFLLSRSEERSPEETNAYINDNLRKALGHEYRAFYDVADWLTYFCRVEIRENLSNATIKKSYCAQYGDATYQTTKAFINQLPFTIAKRRNQKDIANVSNQLMDELFLYQETIETLLTIYRQVQDIL